ncbi:FMN-binding negative transcriptional regulator [Massilia agilis]|uniref:FMN-binding negative transcriptional regulator n=1 Tax=Massilia agilis TaxID=1811226 RepID=A0ABT2DDV8_9BURK|nr:FMN-binding negative transcriptional regulator [Massilia agilis]MCS0809502.1 FMN-binding negative transcriptional regulator [Massilia agilis]
MYMPRANEETRIDVMHALVAEHPLGALVRVGDNGLDADHIPFEIAAPTPDAPFGVLRAHVARGNPLWREDGAQVMVLFQGPAFYITPELYEEKARSGKVVPTWNYAVVHAHGKLRTIDDPQWVLDLVQRLTNRHEGGRATPWQVSDAPQEYVDTLLKAIVGIEIPIARLEGKWKISQNRSAQDYARMAAGLAGTEGGAPLARLMEQWHSAA